MQSATPLGESHNLAYCCALQSYTVVHLRAPGLMHLAGSGELNSKHVHDDAAAADKTG